MTSKDTTVQLDNFNTKTPILKVIIKRKLFDTTQSIQNDLKLVFIGNVHNEIKTICKKIEEGKPLSKDDKDTLNNNIPFFDKKIGSITEYDIKFVFITINPYTINQHFQLLLLDILYHLQVIPTLDNVKKGLSLFSFPRITDTNYHFNVIEYLFFSLEEDATTGLNLVKTLIDKNMISQNLWNKWEIEKQKISKSKTKLTKEGWLLDLLKLKKDKNYQKYQLIDRPEFVKYIIQELPYLFTSLKEIKGKKQSILNFENIVFFSRNSSKELTSNNNSKLLNRIIQGTFPSNDIFIKKNKSRYDQCLNYNELSQNNTLYCYLNTDIITYISNLEKESNTNVNPFKVFFSGFQNKIKFASLDEWKNIIINNRRNFTTHLENICLNENSLQQLNYYKKNNQLSKNNISWINDNSVLFNKTTGYNNIILDVYNSHLDIDINLSNLFQEIKTSDYFPMVKYVKNGETQSYNIYKPFFRNVNQTTIKTYLTSMDIIQSPRNIENFKHIQYEDYLLIFRKIDNKRVIKLYLFQSGYLILEYSKSVTIPVEDVLMYFNSIDIIYQKVKTLYKLSNLNIPNYEKNFKSTSGSIYRCHIIPHMEQVSTFKIDSKMYYIWFQNNKDNIINKNAIDFPKLFNVDKLSVKDFIENPDYATEIFNYLTSSKYNILKKVCNKLEKSNNFILKSPTLSKIEFYNKDIDNFFSDDNIKNYIIYKLRENKKYKKSEKQKLIDAIKIIFNTTENKAETLINELVDTEEIATHTFKYIIKLNINIIKSSNLFELTISNFNNYQQTSYLSSYLFHIFKDVLLNTSFIHNQKTILHSADNLNPNQDSIFSILSTDLTYLPTPDEKKKIDTNKLSVKDNEKLMDRGNLNPIELEDIDLQNLEDLQNISIDDLNDLDIGEMDINDLIGDIEIDLDLDMVDKMIADEEDEPVSLKDKDSPDDISTEDDTKKDVKSQLQDIKIKEGIGKKGIIKLTDYMKNMRRKFDKDLYEPDVKGSNTRYVYDRTCPSTQSKQPFIVTKEQLDTFKPGSITGYMKYRGNYYVCPRIWDAYVNKPITVEDFLKNNMKSPYTGGLPISMNPKPNVINEKYNVIIRKPTTSEIWEIKNKYPDWPDILKKTEREAYPGLSTGDKHPKKTCVPCCFKLPPEGYDIEKNNIIQNIEKPSSYLKCNYKKGDELLQKKKTKIDDFCITSVYIVNANSKLKSCQIGLLPETIDNLLNNGQKLFLDKTETSITDNSKLFLRRGIRDNKITNIFDTIANILEVNTDDLIRLCIREITPIDFIKMNNGKLIDIFKKSQDYPISSTDNDKFINFLKTYNNIFKYYDITLSEIEEVLDNITKLDFIFPIVKDTQKNTYVLVKIIYRIYTAYYNYIRYLADDKEVKNYQYVLPIFTSKRKWIKAFPEGLNVIIFDKDGKSFKCLNSFNNKSIDCILLIEEEKNYFVPIVQVISQYNKPKVYGVITLNTSLNLDAYQVKKLKKKKPNSISYIENIVDRLSSVTKLLYIQSNLCNYNLKYFFKKLRTSLINSKIKITHQYLDFNDNNYIGYIRIDDKIWLPIYNNNHIEDAIIRTNLDLYRDIYLNKFTIYDYFYNVMAIDLKDILKLHKENKQIKIPIIKKNEKYHFLLLVGFRYQVKTIFINKINNIPYIVGIKLVNELSLPLYPVKYNEEDFKVIYHNVKLETNLTINFDYKTTFYNPLKSLIDDNLDKINNNKDILPKFNKINSGYLKIKEFIDYYTVIFKNHFSKYVYQHQNDKLIKECLQNIKTYKENDNDVLQVYQSIKKITDKIISLENNNLSTLIKNIFKKYDNNNLVLNLKSFIDPKCNNKITKDIYLFSKKDNICKLIINKELYSILFSNLSHSLLYDTNEYNNIFNGRYFVPVSEISLIKRNMNLYHNLYETNFNSNIILSKEEMSYMYKEKFISEYKKQFQFEENDSIDIELDNEDISILKEIIIYNLKGKVISDLTTLFSKIDNTTSFSSRRTKSIKTTIFNSEGFHNPKANFDTCILPFRNKYGKITNKCVSANQIYNKDEIKNNYLKTDDLICPTELDNSRKVKKFGYCPEKPDISNKLTKLKIQDVYQFTDDNTLKKIGNCQFPFIYHNDKIVNPLSGIKPLIKVNFNCETENELLNKGSWCYAKPGKEDIPEGELDIDETLLLIGAKNKEDIYVGDWKMDFAIKNNKVDTKGIKDFYSLLKKGNCEITINKEEQEKIEKKLELNNISRLTMEKYNPNYCLQPESKKGYTKKQLYIFGRDVLNINYKILLNKNFKIKGKNELCELFNEKIRSIKKEKAKALIETGELNPYDKDPLLCLEGPSKGGYTLNQLKDIGITYFNIPEEKGNKMNKQQLCDTIIPQIMKEKKGIDLNIDKIYPQNKNIELCKLPEKKGGLGKIQLNEIARKHLNIETKGKSKDDLCDLIKEKLEAIVSQELESTSDNSQNNKKTKTKNTKSKNNKNIKKTKKLNSKYNSIKNDIIKNKKTKKNNNTTSPNIDLDTIIKNIEKDPDYQNIF